MGDLSQLVVGNQGYFVIRRNLPDIGSLLFQIVDLAYKMVQSVGNQKERCLQGGVVPECLVKNFLGNRNAGCLEFSYQQGISLPVICQQVKTLRQAVDRDLLLNSHQ